LLAGEKMMTEKGRRPVLDDAEPKTRLKLPDGAMLTVGTKQDNDDPAQYGVQLLFTSATSSEPEMNILLPPHSIDVLIHVLQEHANEARFIMGHKMVDYPPKLESKKKKKLSSTTES
jgi:hypothetical protein